MLVNYLLTIDTGESLPSDPSIGFRNGCYHFSTADKEGFLRCLDGNSFSDISQQNAIVRGGELSTIQDVSISIASKAVTAHIERSGMNLLGSKVSMSYILGSGIEREVFRNIQVSEFSQKDDVSFTLTLEDSTFAKVSAVSLKQPKHANFSEELSAYVGEWVWLPIKKLSEGKILYSQGRELSFSLDFEDAETGSGLPTMNGKPAFPSLFYAMRPIPSPSQNTSQTILQTLFWPDSCESKPAWLGLEGSILEVCDGKKYKIVESGRGSYRLPTTGEVAQGIFLTLDELPRDITTVDREPVFINSNASVRDSKVSYRHPKILSFGNNASPLRIGGTASSYYVSLWKGMALANYPHPSIRVATEDGNYKVVPCDIEILESDENYTIFNISDVHDGKIKIKGLLREAPRFCRKKMLKPDSSLPDYYSTDVLHDGYSEELESLPSLPRYFDQLENSVYVYDGEQVPLYDSLAKNPVMKKVITAQGHHYAEPTSQISLYWRLDDSELSNLNINSVWPKLSIRISSEGDAGGIWTQQGHHHEYLNNCSITALLIGDNNNILDSKTNSDYRLSEGGESLVRAGIKPALTFSGDSVKHAKYLFLQINVTPYYRLYIGPDYVGLAETNIYIGGAELAYEGSVPLDKAEIKAFWRGKLIVDPIKLAQMLCTENNIEMDSEKATESQGELRRDVLDEATNYPCIKISNGDILKNKLSELCRAANFSLFSDGCTLYTHYFPTDKNKEPSWIIGESDIIANSYDMTSPESGYISTDYEFSVPTENGMKMLNVSAEEDLVFPSETAWQYADDWTLTGTLENSIFLPRKQNSFRGGIMLPVNLPTSGKYAECQFVGLIQGNLYEIETENWRMKFLLLNMRRRETQIDCIFELASYTSYFESSHYAMYLQMQTATVKPLKGLEQWELLMGGNYPAKYELAEWLYAHSKDALSKVKKHIKMDERYTKPTAIAYTNPDTWLKSICRTVEHNSYVKILVKFKMPLDSLPTDSLYGSNLYNLMLKYVRLTFGRFKTRPIDGWIIGYSLSPEKDSVDITFLSSESLKEKNCYDENETTDQIVLDERSETPDKLIKEKA